jgi:hypothetical protein
LTADKLKRLKTGSATTCPETAEIAGEFKLTSAGEALEAEQN